MLIYIIEDFSRQMESRVAELITEFTKSLDFAGLEAAIKSACARLKATLQQALLQASTLSIFICLVHIHIV